MFDGKEKKPQVNPILKYTRVPEQTSTRFHHCEIEGLEFTGSGSLNVAPGRSKICRKKQKGCRTVQCTQFLAQTQPAIMPHA